MTNARQSTLATLATPAARDRRREVLVRCTRAVGFAYVAGAVLIALAIATKVDVWWPVTVLAYAPRWVVALPLPFAIVALAVTGRRHLLWALPIAVVAQLWILDARVVPLRASPPAGAPPLTIVTLNAGYATTPDRLRALLEATQADVAAVQECAPELAAAFGEPWHTERTSEICLFSRFAIRSADAFDATEIRRAGGYAGAVRYVVDAPGGPLTIVNVHLQTARWGLTEVLEKRFGGGAAMVANTAAREKDSATIRGWLDGSAAGPDVIVAGDFNMPVESAIYRRHWSSLGNAFSRAGLGLGWTKRTRWHGTRIDHVLYGSGLVCTRAAVGPNVGSDHRPMIAKLARSRG